MNQNVRFAIDLAVECHERLKTVKLSNHKLLTAEKFGVEQVLPFILTNLSVIQSLNSIAAIVCVSDRNEEVANVVNMRLHLWHSADEFHWGHNFIAQVHLTRQDPDFAIFLCVACQDKVLLVLGNAQIDVVRGIIICKYG